MVSKAREDLPEPETPVITTSRFLGMSQERLRRLCCRAPRIRRNSMGARILAFDTGGARAYSGKADWRACREFPWFRFEAACPRLAEEEGMKSRSLSRFLAPVCLAAMLGSFVY